MMTKQQIEAALERAKACPPSQDRQAVVDNLEALHRHVRVEAGERLGAAEKKLPACATYTRAQDVETDLLWLESKREDRPPEPGE